MDHLTGTIVAFVEANSHWAPLVIGALAFGESLAVVSLFVPATVILLSIGALVAATGLDFWSVWLGAVIGAALGDIVSYAFGYRYKHRALTIWPLPRYPGMVARGERFVLKYGAWGLFAGRFFGPVRAVGPLIAGVFAMPFILFQAVTFASAMVWAFAMLAPGAGIVALVTP
ncbi:MAG TPA: DedA family protein [Saliniramus sp.]|nr:DedA family protein [Saliniramus sp.]